MNIPFAIASGLTVYLMVKNTITPGTAGTAGVTTPIGTYYSCQQGSQLTSANLKIFNKAGIAYTSDPSQSDVYLSCGFNNVENEFQQIQPHTGLKIYAISGCDRIVAKNSLWQLLVSKYGIARASSIMPTTYLLNSQPDQQIFINELDPDTIIIFKKNIQRQEGLLLKRKKDVSSLANYYSQGYVLAQKYVDHPFLVNGYKINLRVYVLITCAPEPASNSAIKTAYMYQDGFVYYTKKKYKYSTDPAESITTGYISRDMYAKNPLTHTDLKRFIGRRRSQHIFNAIEQNLQFTMDAVNGVICNNVKGKMNFQLFGCDYQINSDLSVYVLEWNKGASLVEFDKRDAELKYKLQEDLFKLVGVIPKGDTEGNPPSSFKKIWSST